jgi:glycosyltransferase involved in cell wall biosynthesis
MVRVSVIVPVYNGAATVAEALDSVLAQRFRDFEVIAVDDGSTDETARVLRSYEGSIRIVTRPNGGISAARNSGFKAASGEYIAFIDCDDAWQPAMLERTVAALDEDASCVLAYANCAVVDSNGRPLNTALVGPETAHAPTFDDLFSRLWPIMPSAVLIRRKAMEEIGGFEEEFRSYGFEDAYCWMRLRELGSFCYVPEPLVKWRFSHFPRPLKNFAAHPEARALFARLVLERWGRSIEPLLRSRKRASRSLLGYIGLIEMRDGNVRRAREAFRRALRLDPRRLKNYLRLLRTYLPADVARALGGRTASHPSNQRPDPRGL